MGRAAALFEPRGLWVGPFQRLVTPVVSSGWQIVAQEWRGLDGSHMWTIGPVHIASGTTPFGADVDEAFRDKEIGRQVDLINRPLYLGGKVPYRDFTCPHCHLTERDGGIDRSPSKRCVYCRWTVS